MHAILNPNIQFKVNMAMKGSDTSPLIGESFGRTLIGPCRKNFVMPNELAIKLIVKVIKGRAWLKFSKDVMVKLAELVG